MELALSGYDISESDGGPVTVETFTSATGV